MATYSIPFDDKRQKIERSKKEQSGNLRVEKEGVVKSEVRGILQTQSNFFCPYFSRYSCTGTNVLNGEGIQVSDIWFNQKDREIKMDLCIKQHKEYSNTLKGTLHQGKYESSKELKGNKYNSYTLVNMNDYCVASVQLSVKDSLPTCKINDSSPLFDDIHVESMDSLVDTIDD